MNELVVQWLFFSSNGTTREIEWGNRYRRLNRPNGKKTYDNGEDSGIY
jgi:hypothetical protein